MVDKEKLREEMLDRIRAGGAWFCTGTDRYTKIGYSKEENCYYARECFLKNGQLDGGAYTFGTDWFDISMRGRHTDIYADADTFKSWDIEPDLSHSGAAKTGGAARGLIDFCRTADDEAMKGGLDAYRISSTNFAAILEIRAGL